ASRSTRRSSRRSSRTCSARDDANRAPEGETGGMQTIEEPVDGGTPAPPSEVFPTWRRAQLEVDRRAGEPLISPEALRTRGFLAPEVVKRVAAWLLEASVPPTAAVRRSYAALERE